MALSSSRCLGFYCCMFTSLLNSGEFFVVWWRSTWTSAYHPQTNGHLEWANHILGNFVSSQQDDWVSLHTLVKFSCNNHTRVQRGLVLIYPYGQHPHLPLPLTVSSEVPAANIMFWDFFGIWQDMKLCLLKTVSSSKSKAGRKAEPLKCPVLVTRYVSPWNTSFWKPHSRSWVHGFWVYSPLSSR